MAKMAIIASSSMPPRLDPLAARVDASAQARKSADRSASAPSSSAMTRTGSGDASTPTTSKPVAGRAGEQFDDELVDARPPPVDRARGEAAVDDAAQLGVPRRVDGDEVPARRLARQALLPHPRGLAQQDAAHGVGAEQPASFNAHHTSS